MTILKSVRMDLTAGEEAILNGAQGETMRKIMASVVSYGELFEAKRLAAVTGAPHLVISIGAEALKPYYAMLDELIDAGLKIPRPFTVDPRPIDDQIVAQGLMADQVYRFLLPNQKQYEQQLQRLGLKDEQAFTCACYLPEVGNTPQAGDILAWSESSAVVFANSVLGARTNRNSAGIDLLCNLIGKAPDYGLLTDKGRQAEWRIDIQTADLPNPQVLGSAIGLKVLEAVPYITGLDRFLASRPLEMITAYLKDMGAAAASNGAVGLYHVENITPEARQYGRDLLAAGSPTYRIDDQVLGDVRRSYPVLWTRDDHRPDICLIGCPHLSLEQLRDWAKHIPGELQRQGLEKAGLLTALCTTPAVLDRFRQYEDEYRRIREAGVALTTICPLMYANNPAVQKTAVVTNSNKLRTYTMARFFEDDDVLDIIVRGVIPEA